MSTIDNTDYSTAPAEPEAELKRLFVLANVSPENRLKLAKFKYTKTSDFAHNS